MKEDICTIPINDVFGVKDGCPICRMRDELEKKALDFVLGPAMMEPDVRHETNRYGFCPEHFRMMYERKNRLQLGLILESHLKYIDEAVFERRKTSILRSAAASAEQNAEEARKIASSCYVCEQINRSVEHELNTFFAMWKKEEEFRQSVAEQPCFCLEHYSLLVAKGAKALGKKDFADFYDVITKVTRNGLLKLQDDVSGFCRMFDYHNNGRDFGELRDAIKNALTFLSGRTPG